MLEA
jgi:hypothetical protein